MAKFHTLIYNISTFLEYYENGKIFKFEINLQSFLSLLTVPYFLHILKIRRFCYPLKSAFHFFIFIFLQPFILSLNYDSYYIIIKLHSLVKTF